MHITTNKTLTKLLWPLIKVTEYLGVHHPKLLIKIRYLARFGHLPNLRDPKDLNEKILHQKLYSDISTWAVLADKYAVQEYIKRCGLEDILIPLYGAWSDENDIDFTTLPNKYILKANNGDGKGSFKVVKDNKSADHDALRVLAGKWLRMKNIGALGAEPQYRKIPPKVIAEQFLESGDSPFPTDYKIWCLNGEPYAILTCADRTTSKLTLGIYDTEWNWIPKALRGTGSYLIAPNPIERPHCLEEMLDIARTLGKPFPQVRVDLYEVNGKVYFGELTFTSLGGMMNYFTPDFLLKMGEKVSLDYER